MDTLTQMRSAVQSDLTVGAESTFIDPSTIDLNLNRSLRKIAGMYPWPPLEDALKTSTVTNQEYYDYPQNWQPNSIWKLRVDGQDYGDPLTFGDYLYEQENDNLSGMTYMWSNQWMRFFIDPTPTANGTNNIELWGQKVVEAMTEDDDTTIFSYVMPELNEAIILETVSMLKSKGEDKSDYVPRVGDLKSIQAQQIITTAIARIKARQAKYQKTKPFFNVPNFFGRRKTVTKIGDFD